MRVRAVKSSDFANVRTAASAFCKFDLEVQTVSCNR